MKKVKSLLAFLALGGLLLSGCEASDLKFWEKNNEPEEQQKEKEEDNTPHIHTWGEWKVDGDYHYRECTVCGEKSEKEHHHGGSSNCEHKAVCEVCGAEYGALDEHQFGEWKMEQGNAEKHYHECSVCHEKEYANHVFNMEIVADEYLVGEKNNNCEEGNYYYKSCICGAHSTAEADKFYVANSHDFSNETVLDADANLASPATCTEPATYYYVCSHCGSFDSDHPEHVFTHGEAKGHHYGELHEEEATFGTYHSNYYFCSDCGHYFEPVEEGGVTTYVEKEYDQIFDMSKVQYNDPLAGTEANPYIMKCKEDFAYLRDLANDSVTFAGKFFRLANDVDFNNDAEHPFGTPIGYADNKPFSGTFDGENHKLMNLYLSPIVGSDSQLKKDALALFSRVTGGTIKNLKIQNVTVKGEGQRCTGLVARLSGGTIENCEILSGNIEGTTECAGIVGCIVTGETKAVIKNCVNRATIKSIGNQYPCLGGILGAVVNGMEGDYEVDGCSNYGYIDASMAETLAYSGGIVGLIRVFKTGTSYEGVIKNNKNFGNVFSNRGTLGGIIGMPRAGLVEHNYQSKDATVTMSVNGEDYHPTQLYSQNFTVQISGQNKGMKLGTIAGEVGSAAVTQFNCYCESNGELAHTYSDGEPLTDEATCQHEGHNGYAHCTICGETFGEIIPQLDHNMEYAITPTTHEHHCTNEGCDYTEGAQPHNMVYQENEHVDATPSSDGLDVYVCSVCGYRDEQVLKYKCSPSCENLEHVEAIAPTCHSEGRIEHYRCTVCGTLYSDALGQNQITLADTVVPTVEHNYIKHEAEMGFAHSNIEYYTCSYEDHDASEGEYFVKENDEYIVKTENEIFSNEGSYGLDGYGTEANPYVILNADDLWAFRSRVNDATKVEDVAQNDTFAGKFVKLGADIDVTGATLGLIGNDDNRPFSGTFDGDNHKIIGFSYSGNDSGGLFSRVKNGAIKNLELENISISTTGQRAGGVVARAENVTIDNVKITGTSSISCGTQQVGGFVGYATKGLTITNSVNNAAVSGNGKGVAGILGILADTSATIVNCTNNGSVTNINTGNTMYTGGIFGCEANGAVTIQNCVNNGTVSSKSEGTGGIVGNVSGTGNKLISNCINNGDVNGLSNGTGGIVGSNAPFTTPVITIENCINRGNVTGSSYVGGIAGLARGNTGAGSKASKILGCSNFGNITATNVAAGGIAGSARINVENCNCNYMAEITLGSVTKFANELGIYGEQLEKDAGSTPEISIGYIVGTQGYYDITSITNCYLSYEYTISIEGSVPDIFANNANIYVWAWGGTTADAGAWYLATKAGANEVNVILPYDVTGMKVTRFDPNISPAWDSEWNATGDVTVVSGTYNYSATM